MKTGTALEDTQPGREPPAREGASSGGKDPAFDLVATARAAEAAGRVLATFSAEEKNSALTAIAEALEGHIENIVEANVEDLDRAAAAGTSDAMLDRLRLDDARVRALAEDVRAVAKLPDPVGAVLDERVLPNGIRLSRRRVPIGVLGVIYESRPNVTVDVATLALKSGNAVILRGGSESLRSNRALVAALRDGLARTRVPPDAISFIDDPDRRRVAELLTLDAHVDMIIPRGGAALHELCKRESTIPVMTGGIGICHVFVDDSADLDRAVDIIENAKVQRPSVCNALDTLLVHEYVAEELLPRVAARLEVSGVELKADPSALPLLERGDHGATVTPVGPGDFDTEWLSLVLGVRVVIGIDQAIAHIAEHSTEHSDSILTRTQEHAERFVNEVDSAAVYVNASTRFTDGGEFGLGAEVAVSTQRLHARGPMGLEELTTYKWIAIGDGHVRT